MEREMTELQARIDMVMELDKARTQGKWTYFAGGYMPGSGDYDCDSIYILDGTETHTHPETGEALIFEVPGTIIFGEDGECLSRDIALMAQAPEMVSIIKELQQKNADLYAAMEIIKQPIQDAYQNAVHLSLENNARVEFEFNGTAYKVSPHRLGKKVAELQAQLSAKDALIAELQKRISNVQDVTNIQCSKGNWDYDSYMRGMANGLICAMAILNNNIEPIYLEPPKGI